MLNTLICVCALLCVAELTDDERQRVAEYRRKEVAATASEIAGMEKEIKAAQRSGNKQQVEELKGKVLALRKRSNELKRAADDELFPAMRDAERDAQATAFRQETEKRREQEIAAAGPVTITRMGIVTNVIGLPELVVEVQNNTDGTIEAIEFQADCFNKFDEPVDKPGGTNRYCGHYGHSIKPGSKEVLTAQLSLQSTTSKADIWISRVKLGSGEVWTQSKEKADKTPYGLAKAKLSDR